MRRRPEHLRPILVEVGFFLLGGAMYHAQPLAGRWLSMLVSIVVSFTYVGLFVWWSASLRQRLLPSRLRTLARFSSMVMCAWMVVREFKYRLAVLDPLLTRQLWYAYYPLRMLLPLLLLLAALSLVSGDDKRSQRHEGILRTLQIAAAVIVSAGMLTNDLHFLAFRSTSDAPLVDSGGYSYGPMYYAAIAFEVGSILACVYLLLHFRGRIRRGRSWALALAPMAMTYAYLLLDLLVLRPLGIRGFWGFPEAMCFGMLLTWEALIYLGLIPHNERYAELFGATMLPLCVTDAGLDAVYESKVPVRASKADLRSSLAGPVALTRDVRLEGHPIRAGYVFWESDLTAINRINDELAEVAEDLSEQNDLLAAENELHERQERIAARAAVYEQAVGELAPQLEGLRGRLAQLDAASPGLAGELAWANVEGAYVKRAVNLRLLAVERSDVDVRDLVACIDETLRALRQLDVMCTVAASGGDTMRARDAAALYGMFQRVVELAGRGLGGMLVHLDAAAPALDLELELLPGTAAVDFAALLDGEGLAAFEEDGTVYVRLSCPSEVLR